MLIRIVSLGAFIPFAQLHSLLCFLAKRSEIIPIDKIGEHLIKSTQSNLHLQP